MMKGNSLREISLKHLTRKENIIYGLIIGILILILYVLLTIINFAINFRVDTYKYNIQSRIILLNGKAMDGITDKSKEELDAISTFPHVSLNISELYYNPSYQEIPELSINDLKANIQVKAIFDDNTIKIVNGIAPKNDNEIVIPVKFYPYGEDNIDKNKIINGKELIGKTITLHSEKGYFSIDPSDKEKSRQWYKNRKEIIFKIVGTYNSELGMFERNTCFVSKKALVNLKDDYGGSDATVVAGGSSTYTPIEYGRMIVVDKYKNVKLVSDYLTNNDYYNDTAMSFDEVEYGMILLIPLFISIIILIITLLLLKNFINKKIKNNQNYLGLLKVFGYNDKDTKNILLFENIFVVFGSILIAFILYITLFLITSNISSIFAYTDYFSVTIRKPYIYIITTTFIFIIYICLINNKVCDKFLNKNINELLKDD